jgi:hypothetical protein
LIDHAEDYIRNAALEASWAQVDAKVQTRRERRLALWGFLIVAAVWIGDLVYKPLMFSGWFNCLRPGGIWTARRDPIIGGLPVYLMK